MSEYHIPVLLKESIEGLNIQPEGVYLDLTYGGGGHSRAILDRLEGGVLMGFDQDEDAVAHMPEDRRFIPVHHNFRYMRNFVRYYELKGVDGILADLGVSSHEFDEAERGFSFRFDAELDMRMNRKSRLKASDVLNTYSEEALLAIFRNYGEIENAGRLVGAIAKRRQEQSLLTSGDLYQGIQACIPKMKEKKYLAKVYQALRIEVNGELEALKEMLEQTKEIVRKFNAVYGDTLVEPEMLLPDNKACLRLPGIDGKAKMSKSLGNCIYLGEDADEVKKKVMSMFTDPNHLRVEDPGQVEGNPVFTYLDAFSRPEHFERHFPDYQNIEEMKAHYTRGGLGDMKVKKFLNNVLQDELEPIRSRRRELEKDIPAIYDILKEGSIRAREAAARTLDDVRRAMKINYFEDMDLISEQAKKYARSC